MKEMIKKRKSTRSFLCKAVSAEELSKLQSFIRSAKALYPDICVEAEVLTKEQVKCILPWLPPQVLAIYSEEKFGAQENIGFLFQQLDLYLHKEGIGACWLGMGRVNGKAEIKDKGNLKFMMMLAFGYPKGELYRKDKSAFRRRALSDISDREDERLESARLAPSSVNSQPWYFTHEGETIHVYCKEQGLFKNKFLSDMNRMDVGIALAHMYVSYPDTFSFSREEAPALQGYGYIGSFTV